MRVRGRAVAPVAGVLSLGLVLAACGSDGGADGSGDGMMDVTVASPAAALTASFLPKFGVEQGIFEDNGLRGEFVAANSSAEIATAIVSGSADFGTVTPATYLPLVEKGADLRYFLNEYPIEISLVAGPDVQLSHADAAFPDNLLDAKGKQIGVPALGSSFTTIFDALAAQAGLSPSDYTYVAIGTQGPPAIQSGQIDLLLTNIPDEVRLGEGNFQMILDSAKLREAIDGDSVLSAAYVTTGDQDMELVSRFCKAMTETIEFARDPANADVIAEAIAAEYDMSTEDGKKVWERWGDGFVIKPVTEQEWGATTNSLLYESLAAPAFGDAVMTGVC